MFVLAALGAVVYAVTAPNASGFTNARILFFHLPCAFMTTASVLAGAGTALSSLTQLCSSEWGYSSTSERLREAATERARVSR